MLRENICLEIGLHNPLRRRYNTSVPHPPVQAEVQVEEQRKTVEDYYIPSLADWDWRSL